MNDTKQSWYLPIVVYLLRIYTRTASYVSVNYGIAKEYLLLTVIYRLWSVCADKLKMVPQFITGEDTVTILYAGIIKPVEHTPADAANSSVAGATIKIWPYKLGKSKKDRTDVTKLIQYTTWIYGDSYTSLMKYISKHSPQLGDMVLYVYYRKDNETIVRKMKLDMFNKKYMYKNTKNNINFETVEFVDSNSKTCK